MDSMHLLCGAVHKGPYLIDLGIIRDDLEAFEFKGTYGKVDHGGRLFWGLALERLLLVYSKVTQNRVLARPATKKPNSCLRKRYLGWYWKIPSRWDDGEDYQSRKVLSNLCGAAAVCPSVRQETPSFSLSTWYHWVTLLINGFRYLVSHHLRQACVKDINHQEGVIR